MSRISNPRAKRTIGSYQIVAKLGDGAMSSVYKGRDPVSGAVVAIKLASTAMTRDPVMVKRFEQFSDAKHAGVRCDIYALGATLYMALTGKLPFDGPGLASILRQKMANELLPPRRLVPALSERVEWAVRRAVIADPERRFAT